MDIHRAGALRNSIVVWSDWIRGAKAVRGDLVAQGGVTVSTAGPTFAESRRANEENAIGKKILVPEWLAGTARNETSQFGEDGLIEAILQKIGETNRWCFEVGAGNGKKLSNTWLLRSKGWHAVLIEADRNEFAALREHATEIVQVVHERIEPPSLDRILKEAGAPVDLDFGSIDIDGQDYHVWDGMRQFVPRFMCVEFSPYKRDGDEYIPPLDPDDSTQAGINSIVDLGISKGYRPVYMTDVNVVFVREDCCDST